MKSQKHHATINKIKKIISDSRLNPQELRYVFSEVRKQSGLKIPRGKKKLPDFLNAAEIYKILEISKEEPFDNLLLEFQIFTGLRIGETSNLLISDIDWYSNQLKVRDGKTGDRIVPITNNLQSKLRLYLGQRKIGYLFCKKNNKKYSPRRLQQICKFWLDKLGSVKNLHTHSLRHTFACLCLARGMKIEQVKVLLGHSSIKTTEIYAKLELSSIKEEYLRLMDKRG